MSNIYGRGAYDVKVDKSCELFLQKCFIKDVLQGLKYASVKYASVIQTELFREIKLLLTNLETEIVYNEYHDEIN